MRRFSSWTAIFCDLAISALFLFLSLLACLLVVTLVLVATAPTVATAPGSGTSQVVIGVALTLGVVTGCVVAMISFGAWRRRRERAELEADDEAAVPRKRVRRRTASRRPANDRRLRQAAAEAPKGDNDGEPIEKIVDLARRKPRGS